MLRAMINVNSRITYNPDTNRYNMNNPDKTDIKNKYGIPILVSNNVHPCRNAAYAANMWLVK